MPTLTVTHPHTRGDRVSRLQRLLKEYGCSPGAVDGDFGPRTAAACVAAKRKLGYPLAICAPTAGEALIGYLTGKKRRSPAMLARAAKRRLLARERRSKAKLRLRALGYARGDIGTHEGPNNLVKYNTWWTGHGNDGGAYCMRADSYWYVKAGSKAIDPRAGRFENTDYFLGRAQAGEHGLRVVAEPLPGDLFVIDFDGHTNPDHAGIVERVNGSQVETIEANATLADGRQGVGRHTRPRGQCWFVRFGQ
jgi:hypothetical protein